MTFTSEVDSGWYLQRSSVPFEGSIKTFTFCDDLSDCLYAYILQGVVMVSIVQNNHQQYGTVLIFVKTNNVR